MSAAAQKDGIPVEIDQLGKTQAGLHGEQQQGVIAPPQPCRPIRGGEDGLDLRSVKEMDLTLVVALARYRQHTLDMSPVGRLFEGCETEEGTDGRQPQITGSDAGGSVLLEIIQESTDEGGIQIVERQVRRRLVEPCLGKGKGAIRLGCGWWSGLIRVNGLAEA